MQTVLFFKTLLKGMKLPVLHQAFHRHQFTAVGLDREHGARFDCFPIEDNRARPAVSGVATYVRTSQSGNIADKVDQQHPGFDRGFANTAIYFDLN